MLCVDICVDISVFVMFQLILCLSYLLAALERPSWNNEYTLHVFRSLLPFIASPKAKVCKLYVKACLQLLSCLLAVPH